jgi:hypothetical protein
MPMRTKKGNVTATARKKAGNKKGKFPIFDQKSALSAIRLRGHGDRQAVLRRAMAWASRNNNARVKSAVKRAREADRKRKGKK